MQKTPTASADASWLPLAQVRTLLSDQPALQQRYSDTLLDSYVDDNKRVKWCALFRLHAAQHAAPSVPVCWGLEMHLLQHALPRMHISTYPARLMQQSCTSLASLALRMQVPQRAALWPGGAGGQRAALRAHLPLWAAVLLCLLPGAAQPLLLRHVRLATRHAPVAPAVSIPPMMLY